ncbi:MAG: methyltransferase domain-containing protein [Krumholzibacteria bacterium]|nr:methyltransferase domain-containing protein [Candidatus Krumholzibacteria bacterium]
MPFAPLPGPFLDEAGALASRPHTVLELGCGGGGLTGILRRLGLQVVALDRVRPLPQGEAALLGDALAPPVRTGACDLVVAANLLRHLAARRRIRDVLAPWTGLLRPGAALYLFEDAPRPARGPAGNYGRLHGLLHRLDPATRGPLLEVAPCLEAARELGLRADSGQWTNTWPVDPAAVLAMLRSGRPRVGGEVDDLIAGIEREGIVCGPAWWMRARQDETLTGSAAR